MLVYSLSLLYLLFSYFTWKDIKHFCWLMAGLTFIDSTGIFYSAQHFFYWVAFTDVLIIAFSLVLSNSIRRNVIIFVSVVSCALNLYEALSLYQTIFYPYYNTIQFIITEIILIAAIYKGTRKNVKIN